MNIPDIRTPSSPKSTADGSLALYFTYDPGFSRFFGALRLKSEAAPRARTSRHIPAHRFGHGERKTG